MIVLVPSTIALLPAYESIDDPVADLRAACREAVAPLVERNPLRVAVVAAGARPDNVERGVTAGAGERVAAQLLDETGYAGEVTALGDIEMENADVPVLVVANGSARRSEKAPGHLDGRAAAFDERIDTALRSADGVVLQELDAALAEDLWCHDAPPLHTLGRLLEQRRPSELEVAYDGDPYGVRYWVVTWR